MQFFLTWLISAITDLIGKNLMSVGARIIFSVAVVGLLVSIAVAYVQAMNTLITTVSVTVPEVVAMSWSWVAPTNTNACFAMIVTARIVKFMFVKYSDYIGKKADYVSRAA